MKPAKSLEYTPDPNKFDLVTHRWNGQGHLVATNHYRTYIMDGRQYFERPLNSGNLWFENNQPAGRVHLTFNEKGHIAHKEFHFEEAHVAWIAPLTGDDKLHYELEQERVRGKALAAELEAIKREHGITLKPEAEAALAEPTLKKRG